MQQRVFLTVLLGLTLAGCDDSRQRLAREAGPDRASLDLSRAGDARSLEAARHDGRVGDGNKVERAAPDQDRTKSGTIVPLYSYPTHSSWTQIIAAKQANLSVPVVAIVNVNSGPGSAPDAAFTSGIQTLTTAGIVAVGYVDTSYASVDQATVKAEIDKWKSFYPQVTGIFFDQQTSTAGKEPYYQAVSSYAKSKGLGFTIGNPGADIPQSYLGVVDTMFIYENAGLPSLASLGGWHANVDKKNFGIIPYGVSGLDPAFIATAKKSIGYIYVTDDGMPNPWDTLPAYFSQLLGELAK